MAPEVILEDKYQVTQASDIWSLGCTIIELITGKPPYFDLPHFTAMIKIVNEASPPLPEGISDDMKDFLKLCFEKDPSKRIDAKNLLKHKLLNQLDKNEL
jgi:serine/threonine protein kinase